MARDEVAGATRCDSAADLQPALEQHHLAAAPGQLERDARAHDAAADDEDVRRARPTAHRPATLAACSPGSRPPAPARIGRSGPPRRDRDRRLPHRRGAFSDRHGRRSALLAGHSILARRRDALEAPRPRTAAAGYEPRGHADMYGCHVVEPNDGGADLGVVFFHNAGYSTACGHGTIALVTWALDTGIVPRTRGRDARRRRRAVRTARDVGDGGRRAGRVRPVSQRARLRLGDGACAPPGSRSTSPSAARSMRRARERVERRELPRLIELGRPEKRELEAGTRSSIRSSPSSGTSTAWSSGRAEPGDGLTQRNVTVFADGEVDRSPCGSGTSARLASSTPPVSFRAATSCATSRSSAAGSGPRGRGRTVGGRAAVVTEVTGSAYRTGESRFVLDPHDGLGTGFLLR